MYFEYLVEACIRMTIRTNTVHIRIKSITVDLNFLLWVVFYGTFICRNMIVSINCSALNLKTSSDHVLFIYLLSHIIIKALKHLTLRAPSLAINKKMGSQILNLAPDTR